MKHSKSLALCAVLATMPGHSARRDDLAELFWPGISYGHARCLLRQAIFYLSERLGESVICADDSSLSLDTDRLLIDVVEFENALKKQA
jgi:DNA-binding SARP family transcriptional activator